jgi:hypothetical protein
MPGGLKITGEAMFFDLLGGSQSAACAPHSYQSRQQHLEIIGEPGWDRTIDPLIKSYREIS